MRVRITLLLIGCALALQSCTQNFVVKPRVESGQTSLLFYNSGLLSEEQFTPCLSELILYRDTQPLTVAWLIRSEGACIPTAAVEIGRTPPGFSEITRFASLPAGAKVHVSARIGSGRWGASDPWQLEGHSGDNIPD